MNSQVDFIDPNISWTGSVPSHWTRSRHSAILEEVNHLVGDMAKDETLLSLTKQGVIRRDLAEGKGKFPASFDTYRLVEANQLVFCLFDVDETPRTVGLAHERGMVTGAYDVFAVNTSIADPQFLEYYFIGIDNEKRFRPLYTGLRKVIQKPRFKSAPIMLPPLDEQRAIADYLDRETQKIDELITEQRGLIETLRERRQAVIDIALEEFDWNVPLGSACDLVQTGPFGSQLKADEYEVGGVPVINPTHFTTGKISPNPAVSIAEPVARRLSRHALKEGDVITARRGILGSCAIVVGADLPAICGTGSAILRPNNFTVPSFLAHVFTTRRCRQDLELAGVGSTMVSVNSTMLSRLRIPRPTTDQQWATVNKTSTETSRIDELISESEDLIDLSQERRAALITAAVTGQIDVRTAA